MIRSHLFFFSVNDLYSLFIFPIVIGLLYFLQAFLFILNISPLQWYKLQVII